MNFVCASNIFHFVSLSLFFCDIVLVLPNLNPHKKAPHGSICDCDTCETMKLPIFIIKFTIYLFSIHKSRFLKFDSPCMWMEVIVCCWFDLLQTIRSSCAYHSLTLSILISCIPEERMRSTFVINAAITNCWCYNIKKYRIFKLNDASPLVLHNNCLSLLFFNSSVILVVMEQEEIKWPLFPFLVFF